MKANLATSIRQRLLNRARQEQVTFDAVLNRCGREQLLWLQWSFCCVGSPSQRKDRAMALHCISSWLIRSSSSAKLGISPRSMPESVMAL